jgi:hypothetical protein
MFIAFTAPNARATELLIEKPGADGTGGERTHLLQKTLHATN